MGSFSERLGIIPVKVLQLDKMDDELRNRLWNAIRYEWETWSLNSRIGYYRYAWDSYFKRSIDEIRINEGDRFEAIRSCFFACSWNEAYDLVEFTCKFASELSKERNSASADSHFQMLVAGVNGALESERSGYRFVSSCLVPITSPEEIGEIENALSTPDTVSAHFQQSLLLFRDRENPNYRNAISEAISAVEAMCRLVTGDNKATLGKALKELGNHNEFDDHPALIEAFQKIYGYTSDAKGIRHAMSDLTSVDIEDAQFMIVACSTFVNYLRAKAIRAGIALEEESAESVHSQN